MKNNYTEDPLAVSYSRKMGGWGGGGGGGRERVLKLGPRIDIYFFSVGCNV